MILVDEGLCDACGTCAGVCPVNAVIIEAVGVRIDEGACTGCGACVAVCPVGALRAEAGDSGAVAAGPDSAGS